MHQDALFGKRVIYRKGFPIEKLNFKRDLCIKKVTKHKSRKKMCYREYRVIIGLCMSNEAQPENLVTK